MSGIQSCCNPVPPLVTEYITILHKLITRARDIPDDQLHAIAVADCGSEEKLQLAGMAETTTQLVCECLYLLSNVYF